MEKMIHLLALAGILSLFLRSTDEGKPLNFLLLKWGYICPKWLYKSTIGCAECRSLWLSVLSMIGYSKYYSDWNHLIYVPLLMIFTYIGYKLLQ